MAAAAGCAGRRAAGAEAVGVAVFGLLAGGKGGKLVCDGKHEVLAERVGAHVVDIVGRYGATHVAVLAQQVVGAQRQGEVAAAQQLVGEGGVPHPHTLVVALGVARCGREVEVGVEHQAKGGVVRAVERGAVCVHGAARGGLERVVDGRERVARTQLYLGALGTEGQRGAYVKIECPGDVALTVVEAHGARVVQHQMIVDGPRLIGQRKGYHIHGAHVPHAVDVGIRCDAAAGGGVKCGARHDGVLVHVGKYHRHHRALGLLVEVGVAHAYAVGKGGVELGVTDHYLQRVGHIGHGLQLAHRGLRGAAEVVDVDRLRLAAAPAVAQVGGVVPHPALGDVAGRVDQVGRLGARGYQRGAHVDGVGAAGVLESGADVLVEEVVAEAVGELVGKHEVGADDGVGIPAAGEVDGMVVGETVGIVPAVLHAVCHGDEVAAAHVADGLGPAQAGRYVVAPVAVVGIAVGEVDGVLEEVKLIPGVRRRVLAHVAEAVVGKEREGAPGPRAEFMVVYQPAACLPGVAAGVVAVAAGCHGRARGVAGAGQGGVDRP